MVEAIDNPSLEVIERWTESVESVAGKGNSGYGSTATSANNKPLYARMFLMGLPTYRKDLEGNEIAINASYQCECYSTKGLNELYKIDDASHKAMVGMGFERTFGPELMDNAESNIKRLVSRYSLLYTGIFLSK